MRLCQGRFSSYFEVMPEVVTQLCLCHEILMDLFLWLRDKMCGAAPIPVSALWEREETVTSTATLLDSFVITDCGQRLGDLIHGQIKPMRKHQLFSISTFFCAIY